MTTKPKKKGKRMSAKTETITAYKAFDKNLSCRGFTYEVGRTYIHKGRGFHACAEPFDVWNYYGVFETRYAEVELSDATQTHDEDSKIAAASITIKAEISLPEFIKNAVKRLIERTSENAKKGEAATSGYGSQLATSGYGSQLAASGYGSHLAASGHDSHLAASGYGSKLAASGDGSRLAASGHDSHLAASGDGSKLAASGHASQLAASGDGSQLAASGLYSQLAASGDSSQLAASGDDSVIASSAINAMAKGGDGTWISLAEFDTNKNCVGFCVGCIGKDGLKPDTWYRAMGGKLVTAE